jgi:hypothetical protein
LLVEGATYTTTQAATPDEAAALSKINQIISALALNGVTPTVNKVSYTAPVAGTASDLNGTDGSYVFTVNLNKGGGVQQTTAQLTLTITATPYVVMNTQTPVITAQAQPAYYYEYDKPKPLTVTASVTDNGTLSCQWYHNTTTDSNTDGTAIPGTTDATHTPPTDIPGTVYYYVAVTNTNNSVNGTKTATMTSRTAEVTVTEPVFPKIYRKVTLTVSPHFANDPAPGVFNIESTHNLYITLTPLASLPEGYEPKVTTSRISPPDDRGGVRITLNNDGTYTVRIAQIQQNMTVTVDVGFPVANEHIADARVWSYGNRLYVAAATDGL